MTSNETVIHYRKRLLNCAQKHNVTAVCRIFGISRTRYYEILADFLKFGEAGLYPKAKIPVMPNKIRGEAEKAILDLALEYPTYGPARLANELKAKTEGALSYSSGGIYFVLKRNGLSRKKARLYRSYMDSSSLVTLEKILKDEVPKEVHIETDHTGELLGQDSFKLGYIKGLGKIYHQAAIDCNCSFGFTKIYNSRSADTSVDLLKQKVLPFYKAMGVKIERVITDNGKEYTHHSKASRPKHKYEKFLKDNLVVHSLTKVRSPETNGYVERFHRTILEEFFLLALRKKVYVNLAQLQFDLDKFMIEYNFRRTHQGYKLKGTTPIRKFMEGIKSPLMISV